ncbi:Hsp70 family protein [Lyngbya confervoides]|uniref:Hsp70 family protein n=1 Tax=Lyngbya confervoides BDU141951 TaxID=1574623 RepID=A0ABD4SYW4_9CYAN|nr:Hsp70 family protein [Lyngbya confervoides]MCM1981484.1 Hsp70 family protein [Lyngbya confervoides BDU141951]
MSYALDFGTSNTVIARWNPAAEKSEILRLPDLSAQLGQNPALIPSLLYVENAAQPHVVAGQAVRDRGLDIHHDPRFFRAFKRGIGTPIQGFLPILEDQSITFEQVGQWYLHQIMTQLQQQYPDAKQSLVVTVPVDSFEAYRHWLGAVFSHLEVEQVRMIDEPTAAALGYGKAHQDCLLVLDFGGGTLDFSLVQLDPQSRQASPALGFILKWGDQSFAQSSGQRQRTARVLAKAGQNLGGSDLDNWIVDHFVQTQNLPACALTARLAERLKIQLSLQTQATEVYFDDQAFESYDLSLDRAEFEQILQQHQFFDRLDGCLQQVIQGAQRQGLKIEDIDAVLMVGGSSQIPAVRHWVEQYFSADKVLSHRPFDAIAHGALQLIQGTEVRDFLYHSYGVRYWDRRHNTHAWHPIIPAGQPYPMQEAIELILGASTEGQPSIELVIGELGSEHLGGTEVFFDGDRLVTRSLSTAQAQIHPLNDTEGGRQIAPLRPPGYPGSDRIKVLFRVDAQRILRMTVEDLLTQETLLDNQVVAALS